MGLIKLLLLALLTLSVHAVDMDMCLYHYKQGNKYINMATEQADDKTKRDVYMKAAITAYIEAKYACPPSVKDELIITIADITKMLDYK